MSNKLYVGNLAATTTERDLESLFSPHGNVVGVNLPTRGGAGRPAEVGTVTMATPAGARAAILALHGKEVGALTLSVTETRPLNSTK